MDAYSKFLARSGALRNQPCDYEAVTVLHLADGTTQEGVHTRRVVCKGVTRRGNITVFEFVDVDRAALERVFPFETFTVADFPELFVDHVGRRVPQGVGTVTKVPLTWVTKAGGTWKYAGPKRLHGAEAVLAVYRGSQPGKGALVDPSEYTVGTMAGSSTGVSVLTVNFTKEQIDDEGRPYAIDADFDLGGTRTPSAEVQRVLGLYGLTADAATFAAAAAADAAAGFLVDPLYGGTENGKTGNAIIEDLLQVARGRLSQTATGAWAIVQDVSKAATRQFDTASDLIKIDEFGDGDRKKTVSLSYRPRTSGRDDYAGNLSRTTTGASGELQLKNPYIRDHGVADRLVCYWQKRMNTLTQARGAIHAVQIADGEVINITDNVGWRGARDWILAGISRPADANRVTLREYDANVYVYTAEMLPTDATNGYAPDYSFTLPVAPTGLQVVTLTAVAAADGKITATALLRAIPPAANWARLMVQLEDVATKEQFTQQMFLTAGNYDATIPNLKHNTLYAVRAWAVNANNVDGNLATIANITTANYSNVPLAPTGLTVVSQGTNSDIDGTLRAYALVRAVPPVANFAQLKARLTDTTTGEQHTQQLFLVGGNYEATFEGLRPNRLHSIVTWAVNPTNVDGTTATIANFTTANFTTAPNAVSSIAVQQQSPRQTFLDWDTPAEVAGQPKIRRYIVFKKTGAGSFVEIIRLDATHWLDDNIAIGTAYQYKVRTEDMVGNESGDSGTVSITPAAVINDGLIVPQGVSGGSIANASINRGRGNTGTGSQSGSIGPGGSVSVGGDVYMFFPGVGADVGIAPTYLWANLGTPPNDQGIFYLYNSTGNTGNYGAIWRTFNP